MSKKICALLSVDNNYDQPPNNIVTWWQVKPSIEVLSKTLEVDFSTSSDEHIIAVVGVHQGNDIDIDGTSYRLQFLTEGDKV